MDQNEAKRLVALAALAELPPEGIIGLGSGSTAKLFIDELGKLVAAGRRYQGVPTSEGSRVQALALGIPLLDDAGPWAIAVTVDGADEVDEGLNLIKGGGAAHLREKIVNRASARNVIVVDESKLSRRLGETWPVPLEVLPFGLGATLQHLERLGVPKVRKKDGAPVFTDARNVVVDLQVEPLEAPAQLDEALRRIPGVMETGLFIGRADVVLVAGATGVRTLRSAAPSAGGTSQR
jgi:ribose 5-phosphate isomerase A